MILSTVSEADSWCKVYLSGRSENELKFNLGFLANFSHFIYTGNQISSSRIGESIELEQLTNKSLYLIYVPTIKSLENLLHFYA